MDVVGLTGPAELLGRLAKERLRRLRARADVHVEVRRGHDATSIAECLDLSVDEARRLMRSPRSQTFDVECSIEDVVLAAVLERSDRGALLETIGGLAWSPAADLILADLTAEGWLSAAEYDAVRHTWTTTRRAQREGWLTAQSLAERMRRALAEDDELWLMQLIRTARHEVAQMITDATDLLPSWRAAPPPLDSPWDALLAAVVDREFHFAGLPTPAWTYDRTLTEEWIPEQDDIPAEQVRADTPPWLAERLIFLSASHLDDPNRR